MTVGATFTVTSRFSQSLDTCPEPLNETRMPRGRDAERTYVEIRLRKTRKLVAAQGGRLMRDIAAGSVARLAFTLPIDGFVMTSLSPLRSVTR